MLRKLLLDLGFAPCELEEIGAHSLKVTCLAWAAKWGMDREARRMLGYHLRAGDKSLECYSRCSMAGPLRALDVVLKDIKLGKFNPDTTKSGLFTEGSEKLTDPTSSSSSARSSSCSAVGSDVEVLDEDVEAAEADDIIQNLDTKCVHLAASEQTLRCGKDFPKRWQKQRALEPEGRLCSRCF